MNCALDGAGQGGAEAGLDDGQHQAERGDAAGAGDAVAVDGVKVADEVDLGELLLDRRQVLPMDGAAAAAQQPGGGQRERAGAEAAKRHAIAREPAQRGGDPRIDGFADVDAAAGEQQAGAGQVGHRRGRVQR